MIPLGRHCELLEYHLIHGYRKYSWYLWHNCYQLWKDVSCKLQSCY